VGYRDPVAVALVADAMAELARRYGGDGDETPMDPAQFEPPHGGFLVAWLGDEPVGCAGWRSSAGDPEAAELKRMYVRPQARGRGVATAVLHEIEEAARRAGRLRVILETGDRQPEAIALYRREGYRTIQNFGYYKDEPGVLSFGRELSGRELTAGDWRPGTDGRDWRPRRA
jgi:GNAT superfamily N-acetyltransferase